MTREEILETVTKHMLAQSERSTDGAGACMYRGQDGLACAVGCLMTDEEAEAADLFRGDTDVVILQEAGLIPERLEPHLELLAKLQTIHDSAPVTEWGERLEALK